MERVVIVGAGYGGLTCALRLASAGRGRAQITLVDASDRFVERIRLHQGAATQRPPTHALSELVRGTGIRLKIGRATAIDLERRTVVVGGEALAWDKLVLALGWRIDVDSLPGVRQHAFTLDANRAAELGRAIGGLHRGGRVLIVGGGLTGVEAAAELAEAHPHLRVELVTDAPVADGWSDAARGHLLRTFERLGVSLREGVRARGAASDHVATDAGPIPFDVCVWTVGFAFPALPREAGLAVDARGRVSVDARLRSISCSDVYVVGDLASPVEPTGHPLPMGCKSAQPTGAHAAANIARALFGSAERPLDYAVPLYCVSLGRRDGLIQLARRDGSLTGPVLTSRAAAVVKELVCRSTMWALRLERRGLRAVVWKKTGRVEALPSTRRGFLAAG